MDKQSEYEVLSDSLSFSWLWWWSNKEGVFSSESLVEEDFRKNVVRCSVATSNGLCTVGFVTTPQARPMTLLKGDELDHSKASSLKLVLSKSRDDDFYSDVVVGLETDIVLFYDDIKDMLNKTMIARIERIINQH